MLLLVFVGMKNEEKKILQQKLLRAYEQEAKHPHFYVRVDAKQICDVSLWIVTNRPLGKDAAIDRSARKATTTKQEQEMKQHIILLPSFDVYSMHSSLSLSCYLFQQKV
jgi:hypothetical protein